MERFKAAYALARALVFAAWADGRVTVEEKNFLSVAFERLKHLLDEDRVACMDLLQQKPLQSDGLVVFKELRRALTTQEDRELVLQCMEELFNVDGQVSPEEIDFMNKLDQIINGDEEAFYAELKGIAKNLSF